MNGAVKTEEGIFRDFFGKYALSKTLRFELKPVGKTLENMQNRFGYDKEMRTFLCDQKIEDAYQALKPVLDRIHEKFINESTESVEAKRIGFGSYLDLYRNRKDLKEKSLLAEEAKLRAEFSKCFSAAAKEFKKSAGKNGKGRDILKESSPKVLTESGIMEYVRKNAEEFSGILPAEEIREHVKVFSGFFTYFSGFNQNRENYYATKDERKTAIATRVVHENLPIFCENILTFGNRKSEYESIYEKLKSSGKILEMKDGETGGEKPCVPISPEVFDISSFNKHLSQCGIERYNAAISNANYLVNLYNQSQEDKKTRLKGFKTLYKQIGCGKRETFIEAISCEKDSDRKNAADESLESLFRNAANAGKEYFSGESKDDIIRSISDLARYLRGRESFDGIYWSKAAINTISGRYLANWHELQDRLVASKIFRKPSKESDERASIPDVVGLQSIFSVMDKDASANWQGEGVVFKKSIVEDSGGDRRERNKRYKEVIAKSSSPSRALLGMILSDMEVFAEAFVRDAENVFGLANYSDEKGKESIKQWLDSMLGVVRIAQYFDVRPDKVAKAKGAPMESELAEGLKTILHSTDANWFRFYDLTRNFLTKKPQDDVKKNKLKLNFENSTLAGGWDVNKEPDNYCVIFRDDQKRHFLGVIAKQKEKGDNSLFKKRKGNELYKVLALQESFFKMEYKLLPGPNKMLPKCLLPKSNRKKYGATDEILSVYDRGSFKKGDSFSREDLGKVIDFYKEALRRYEEWSCFDFSFRPTEEYSDISQFYSEVEKQGYQNIFVPVNKNTVDSLVNEGKIYLFEIRNQDSNDGKKDGHRSNLHTMYWRALFEDIENRPKLNGEAEIFYRPALPQEKWEKVPNKKGRDGSDIIKHYRFSKEKFAFHVPITLNFCRKDFAINRQMTERMRSNEDVLFLGIDRGEKHLVYYSLVDSEGKLIEQGTLNIPFLDKDGNRRTVRVIGVDGKEYLCHDYNELLEVRAGDMHFARKNWKTIGTIKELKDGYISQVVRKIVDIAVSRGAFIVLENLSIGFKRGRQKIEKSVYQKLELALAKKLNFLVDKSAKLGEIGSVTRALQLTPLVNTSGDIKSNQFGIMLYIRANYTSQTDPLTGWRKTIYLKSGSEENIRKEIQGAFEDIRFDGKDYVFDYVEKIDKGRIPLKRWLLYSGINGKSLDRFRGKNTSGKWEVERYDVAKMLETLFSSYNRERSLLKQIGEELPLKKIEDDSRIAKYSAYEQLRFAIDLIQQIRNTGREGDERDADFLQSPVRSANGEHFDSRVVADKERQGEIISLPVSGDANGAYNIARKGILMAEHVRRDGYKVYISDDEWAVWLDNKEKWIEWMRENEKDLKRKEKNAE